MYNALLFFVQIQHQADSLHLDIFLKILSDISVLKIHFEKNPLRGRVNQLEIRTHPIAHSNKENQGCVVREYVQE